MTNLEVFYICPVCFQVCDSEIECHAHKMVECEPGPPGDSKRSPIRDQFGEYASRAPRWYYEALGRVAEAE